MKLVNVYLRPDALEQLYRLLEERIELDGVNISHRQMPSWRQHRSFVASRPYRVWYLIIGDEGGVAGSAYLSKADEIGIFLFNEFRGRGIGPKAVAELIRRHRRPRYLANINPANERSIAMFEALGFKIIQKTFELLN